MTTVIGVDPSLTATGLVTWRDGRFYVDTITTLPSMPAPERHHRIVTRALRQADPEPGRTLYVLEDRIVGNVEGNSLLDLEQLRGVLNYGIHRQGHTRVDINAGTLKVWATGSGRASKESMVDAARGRLGRHTYVRNADEADALWLCCMALHHYGVHLWRPPVKHLRALTVPDWPPFTIERTPANAF